MQDLENILKVDAGCRNRAIVIDGVFSMDGTIAQLGNICELAKKYDAIVKVDDSHSTGLSEKQAVVRTNIMK